jgi:hypothetical protein
LGKCHKKAIEKEKPKDDQPKKGKKTKNLSEIEVLDMYKLLEGLVH